MEYYVYMVECADSTLYTGITNDLRRRVEQHNGLKPGGAKYTRSHRPVFLVHIEKYPNKSEASKREREVKDLTHDQKLELINATSKQEILGTI